MSAVVIRHHPKMLRRWAKIYVDKHLQHSENALLWAKNFLERADVEVLAPVVKDEFRRRGKRPV